MLETIAYTYDSTWKDKLASYNGASLTYDAIGNPLTDGTWTYTWQAGRQLATMNKTGTSTSYTYNADGLRIRKTVNSTVTDYTLHGKRVVHLKQGSSNLHFFYDAQGRPSVVDFNGTKYGYAYNSQGDIVALVDGSGTQVVEYTYDAWGKSLTKTGTLATTLGTLNPFRYRGYVYDEETGLYYLRSRYYNPGWGRFVNADTVLGKKGSILSHNVFTYCSNSPLSFSDSNGCNIDDTYNSAGAGGIIIVVDAIALGVAYNQYKSRSETENATLAEPISLPYISDKIEWPEDPAHILYGTRFRGGHDWSPFGIDPKDPKSTAWQKLLPLLKEVYDKGRERWGSGHGSRLVYFTYYFEEYSKGIEVKLYYMAEDVYKVSDAYPVQ